MLDSSLPCSRRERGIRAFRRKRLVDARYGRATPTFLPLLRNCFEDFGYAKRACEWRRMRGAMPISICMACAKAMVSIYQGDLRNVKRWQARSALAGVALPIRHAVCRGAEGWQGVARELDAVDEVRGVENEAALDAVAIGDFARDRKRAERELRALCGPRHGSVVERIVGVRHFGTEPVLTRALGQDRVEGFETVVRCQCGELCIGDVLRAGHRMKLQAGVRRLTGGIDEAECVDAKVRVTAAVSGERLGRQHEVRCSRMAAQKLLDRRRLFGARAALRNGLQESQEIFAIADT